MIATTSHRFFLIFAFNLSFAVVALSQNPATTWQGARAEILNSEQTPYKRPIYVVTISNLKSRHRCLMQSINLDEIVCANHRGATTFRAEDVAALIVPGTHTRWYLYAASFLAAGGAATWGTVILAPVCAPCAVATGVAALFLYWMAPLSAMATDGDTADALLYLAPGQRLKFKLRRAG